MVFVIIRLPIDSHNLNNDGMLPDAVILADSTTAPPLLYAQQVKSQRPDVSIMSAIADTPGAPEINEQTLDGLLTAGRIYVVSPVKGYCPDLLLKRCDFEPAASIYRARPK